ncbi:hypothetical protein CWI38_0242p0030 [Hamiltosporidium tvaerminnensis]|uniref:Uncharacterized protein n=1 Tax=Hamiltosporidium tvaerminnensis TaxID=1176355 RepID=A0A4Q9LZ53_9MICR|nr:hypothetical protein CWI38_0242p0030 [Hamiltosporidium tvaerminnensis]
MLIQSLLATEIIRVNTESCLITDTESEEDMIYDFQKCKRQKIYNNCDNPDSEKEKKIKSNATSETVATPHLEGDKNKASFYPKITALLKGEFSYQEPQILLPPCSIQNLMDNSNQACSRKASEFSLSIDNMLLFHSKSPQKIEYVFVKMCEELHHVFSVNGIHFYTLISHIKFYLKRLELYERFYCRSSSETDLAWIFDETKKLILFQWKDFKRSLYISFFPELFGFGTFINDKYLQSDLKPFHLFRNLFIIHIICSRSRETIEEEKIYFPNKGRLYQKKNCKIILSDQETILSFLILFFESLKTDDIFIPIYLSFRSKLVSKNADESRFTNIPLKKVYFDLFFMLDVKEYVKIHVFLWNNSVDTISNKKIFAQISRYLGFDRLSFTRLDTIKWIIMYKNILTELRFYIQEINTKIAFTLHQKEFLLYYDLFVKCLIKILANEFSLDSMKILRISAKFYKCAIRFLWNVMFEKINFDLAPEFRNEINNLLNKNAIFNYK